MVSKSTIPARVTKVRFAPFRTTKKPTAKGGLTFYLSSISFSKIKIIANNNFHILISLHPIIIIHENLLAPFHGFKTLLRNSRLLVLIDFSQAGVMLDKLYMMLEAFSA
jgi:hypothetical protein